MPKVRSALNFDRDENSDVFSRGAMTDGRTVQSEKDNCDINVIVRRFGVTGVLPQRPLDPMFADFSEVGDFRSAMDAVRAAQESFDGLPAEVRRRFHNSPNELIEFVSVADNYDEALKLGLVNKRPDPPVVTPKE